MYCLRKGFRKATLASIMEIKMISESKFLIDYVAKPEMQWFISL